MPENSVEGILAELKSSPRPVLETLEIYEHEKYESLWRGDPRLYRAFVKKLIDSDHPSRGYELVREGLQPDCHADDLRLEYLAALALARSGNVSKTTELADKLLDSPQLDDSLKSDALSLKGRLHKDLYQRSGNVADAARSASFYQQAFEVKHDWFPCINAATMSLIAGQAEPAARLAASVIELASVDLKKPGGDQDYWLLATLGEAHMICGDMSEARRFYGAAVKIALENQDEGSVASMRRQVQLMARRLPEAETLLDIFGLGNIVIFAGHLLDHPERIVRDDYQPRFPPAPELIDAVRAAIREKLEVLHARVGYSGVACGADLLFCDELLKRGGALHVILPFDKHDFYRTSVDFGMSDEMAEWRARCDRVLDQATEVHYATQDRYLNDAVLFAYGNSFAQGLALIRAERVGLTPAALCVFDPQSPGTVGTVDFLRRNKRRGCRVEVINLATLRAETACAPLDRERWGRALTRQEPSPVHPIRRERRAMLFADVKNYSKVTDERAPNFFIRYLDEVSDMLKGGKVRTLFRNTWGDGLFLVFNDALKCADTALRLVDRIEAVDWLQQGLPEDTTVRVGVHYGPVYQHFDKIIRRKNFFGGQVNRTARIEPVTTPGCVFASEQFAAELAVRPNYDYVLEYVGVEQLHKNNGPCTLYRLARRDSDYVAPR